MPGMGHKMPKDKKAKKTSYDENITKTMAQGRSGLYMDRDENGKLPQDRVKLHYDRMDQMREAKMAQEKKEKKNTSGIFGGDTILGDENNDGNMFTRALSSVGKFIKSFDDRAQPTSSIKKRNSILYQDKK